MTITHQWADPFPSLRLAIAKIVSLLGQGRPPAISWLVVSIVINAIKGMFPGRTFAHVSQEILKNFPAPTYRDSTANIMFRFISSGIRAALPHVNPRHVLRGAGLPMLVLHSGGCFGLKASTAFGVPCKQKIAAHNRLCSTLAVALPSHIAARIWNPANDYQTTKAPSGQIAQRWHVFSISQSEGI